VVLLDREGRAGRSGGGRERSDPAERFYEVLLPGPAGWEMERPAAGVGAELAGQGEQPAAEGAGDAHDTLG
jgi:hypothetical protein